MGNENVEHLKVRLRQLMNKLMDVVNSQCPWLLLCANSIISVWKTDSFAAYIMHAIINRSADFISIFIEYIYNT